MDDLDNAGGEERECADCGQPFSLTAGEIEFFRGKGFQLPRRCLACRRAKSERAGERSVHAFDR